MSSTNIPRQNVITNYMGGISVAGIREYVSLGTKLNGNLSFMGVGATFALECLKMDDKGLRKPHKAIDG